MSDHAKYSPSQLGSLEKCACYINNPHRDSSAADAGTRLHKAVESNNLDLCDNEAEEDAVFSCWGYQDSFRPEYPSEASHEYRELGVGRGVTAGKLDWVIMSGPKADMVDWKFGRNAVAPAAVNVQIQTYTVGLFEAFPDLQEIRSSIVCPFQEGGSSFHTFKREDCTWIMDRVAAIVASCEDVNKVETPHPDTCEFCGRKAECKALGTVALTVSRNIGLPMPIEFEPGRLVLPQDRAKAQLLSIILEDWAKQVRRYNTKAVVEDGIEVPGFELRSRTPSVEILNIVQIVEYLTSVAGLELSETLQACTLSIPKIVTHLHALAKSKGAKRTKPEVRVELLRAIDDHVIESEDKITYLQRKKGITDEHIIQGCPDGGTAGS